jgi:hypothetical protein
MSNQNNSSDIPIKIFASPKAQKTYDRRDEEKIANVVRTQVLPKAKVPYYSVSVKVERASDNSPKSLILYMLRKNSYTADVVKIDVDENYGVKDIQENYLEGAEGGDEAEEELQGVPSFEDYGAVDFVAGTPVPGISTAKKCVVDVADMAAKAGFTPMVLLGSDASVYNYTRYLRSGVQAFVNVGHGWPEGIVLDDGRLRFPWFHALTNRPLEPAVVYFNSCQVHNEPLLPNVMSAGARTFIGGIVNLLIGPSEEVCKCFWEKALNQVEPMGEALINCEKDHYPDKGAHGITGDTGMFLAGHLIVFQHARLRGHHRHIHAMERNFNHPEDRSLNDKISSFVVDSGTWRFYRHSNFRERLGGEFGPGVYSWVEAVGVKNDEVSSVRCIKA